MNKIGPPAETKNSFGNLISKTEAAALAAAILVSGLAVLSKQAKAMVESRKCDIPTSYSGVMAYAPSKNVKAIVTEIKTPHVYDGDIAGWIGMVGKAKGKGQYDLTSLQTGIERVEGQPSSWVYIELIKNGLHVYQRNILPVKTGKPTELEVKEIAKDRWEVDINKQKHGPVFNLPGTEGELEPYLLAENCEKPESAYNDFSYQFKKVDARPIDGHLGHPLDTAESLHQEGYLFKPFANSHDFIASSPSK
jgi:hypothetical protein